jgi:hypothetical protein
MRPMTILKIGVGIVVGLALLYGIGVLIAIASLRDPPFDPPAVAPLGRSAAFEADRILETDAGYVLAGVVGTSDPFRVEPCSGRFALLFLDAQGRTTRATILSGPERSDHCADRVDALVGGDAGGFVVAGTGVRDGGPSALFGGRSTESLRVTFRVDERGAPVETFGAGGRVEGHWAAGRVDNALFTRHLERMTENGAVHDDFVLSDAPLEFWRSFEVEDDLLVAVGFGPGLVIQAFERDEGPSVAYRPLHGAPAPVELGTNLGVADTLLKGDRLYVAMADAAGTRINVVDPRRRTVDLQFGGRGAVRLPGHATSSRLLTDGVGRLVVAVTAIDRGQPGDRLHVLRYGTDGAADTSFGGRMRRNGRDVLLDPGLDDALVDAAGRTVALGGGSTSIVRRESIIVRMDASGMLDPSFGDGGIFRLGAVRPCLLAPAARSGACRGA